MKLTKFRCNSSLFGQYRHGFPACGILYGKNDYFLRENFLMKNEKLLAIYFQKVVYNEKEEGGDGQRPLWIEERRKKKGERREKGTDSTRCGLKEE